jgi:CO/xanthine dehydrogenase Mo-binding subunit
MQLQGLMFAEMMIDQVARMLGRPAHAIREINMYREGDVTHFGQVRRAYPPLQNPMAMQQNHAHVYSSQDKEQQQVQTITSRTCYRGSVYLYRSRRLTFISACLISSQALEFGALTAARKPGCL